MNYTQHPLSAAFPAMQPEEYQSLIDSIASIGVQNPITLLDGMVIDGWHRYTAAQSLCMNCPVVELDDTDPRDFVMAQNKSRRHITIAQLAMAAKAVYQWSASGRPSNNAALSAELTQPEIAAKSGISVRSLRQANEVEKTAAPEVVAAVKRGEIGLPKAAAISKLPQAEQAAAINKPIPKPAPEPEHDDGTLSEAELIAEMQETQAENLQLQERVTLMASDDKAAEIDKLLTRINGLEGRINQLMMQVKTSADGEKYHATVIHKLRKLLGVEGHKEIIAAVTALVSDRRLAA